MSVWLSRRLVSLLLRRIKVGSLIVVEGDERLVFGSGSPTATVRIDSPRTWPNARCAAAAEWLRPLPKACGTRRIWSR